MSSHGAHIILLALLRDGSYICSHAYGYIEHFTFDEQKSAALTGLIRRLNCFIVVQVLQKQIFFRDMAHIVFFITTRQLPI